MSSSSVIIVNWNAEALLRSCIEPLEHDPGVAEIIVVDNASTDHSMAVLRDIERQSRKLLLVQSSSNLGFAGGCNLGAVHARSDVLVFLNADVVLPVGAVAEALRVKTVRRADLLGIKLVGEDGSIHRSAARLPTLKSLIVQSVGLTRVPALRGAGFLMEEWDHATSRHVDHVIGAFYMIDRARYHSLGGMDQSYFVYYEDLDFSKRLRDHGGSVYYEAGISGRHEGGGSTKNVRALRHFYVISSRTIYACRHLSLAGGLLYIASLLTLELAARLLMHVVARDPAGVRETLGAYRYYIRHLPSTLRAARRPGIA